MESTANVLANELVSENATHHQTLIAGRDHQSMKLKKNESSTRQTINVLVVFAFLLSVSAWLARLRGRWQQYADNRFNTRQLQQDIDVYRCALLALLHQGVNPNEIEDRLLNLRPEAHRQIAYNYYVSEMQRILDRSEFNAWVSIAR